MNRTFKTSKRDARRLAIFIPVLAAAFVIAPRVIVADRDDTLQTVRGHVESCDTYHRDGYTVYIHLRDSPAPFRFREPSDMATTVLALCIREREVQINYVSMRRAGQSEDSYWIRGLTDVQSDTIVVDPSDHEVWSKKYARWGWLLGGVGLLAWLYALAILGGLVHAHPEP